MNISQWNEIVKIVGEIDRKIVEHYEGGVGHPLSRFSKNIDVNSIEVPKTVYTKNDQQYDITHKVKYILENWLRKKSFNSPSHKLLSDNVRIETTSSSSPLSYVTSRKDNKLLLHSISSQMGDHEKIYKSPISFSFDPSGIDKMTKVVHDQGLKLLISDAISEAREEAKETYKRG